MDTTASTNDERHTVATYLSDMLALEKHMSAPISTQLGSEDHQDYTEAYALISRIKSINEAHITALEAQLKTTGSPTAEGLKSAWAQLIGGGAAALNTVRKTKVSKSLRDDYTALGLAAISYTMLHATAAGLGDAATAQLAKKHLDDITPLIIDISTSIPGVVLAELAADGENVTITAAQLTQQMSQEAWSGKGTN